MVSTGEDVPRGQSLRARILVTEMEKEGPKAIYWERLTVCQSMANRGLYSGAVAGFVRWLARQYGLVRTNLRHEMEELRRHAEVATHRRTTDIIAQFAVGMRYFLRYALEAKALTEERPSHCGDAAGMRSPPWVVRRQINSRPVTPSHVGWRYLTPRSREVERTS